MTTIETNIGAPLLGYRQIEPVEAPPEHPTVRAAIGQLIRDYRPTRLGKITVDWRAPDFATIIAEVPSEVGQLVTLDVYIDDAGNAGPLS